MKRFALSAFVMGLGFGLIFSFLFVIFNTNEKENPRELIKYIPDEVIIERALELGLIDPSSGIDKDSIKLNQSIE